MHSVYVHTFPNGKKYVGISSNPSYRWGKNGEGYRNQPKVFDAIQMYGWGNVKHEIVLYDVTESEAKEKEIELIKKYDSYRNGYNADLGGGIHRKNFLHPWLSNSQRRFGSYLKQLGLSCQLYEFIEQSKEDRDICERLEEVMQLSLPGFYRALGYVPSQKQMSYLSDGLELAKFYTAMNDTIAIMEDIDE